MDGFDGELHLRLLGERTLLSGGSQDPFGDPLVEQARALATVGALAIPVAQRVVDDYARARALRGLSGPDRFGPPATTAPLPRRIVPCHRVIGGPQGDLVLRYAILSQTETRLAITFRSNAQVPPAARQRPAGMPAGLTSVPSIAVTDDRGNTVTSSAFSGGGTLVQWRGFLTLRPALAPDTGWIELYGERADLGPDLGDRMVTIENFTETDAVERYLAQCLAATSQRPHSRSLYDALEALAAAGLVDPDDPAIATTLAIHQALTQLGGPRVPPPMPPARPAPPAQPAPPARLAEPWRSLLVRHGNTGGSEGTLFVGAATPVFDRISAVLLDLVSSDGGFQCDFELAGPAEIGVAGGSAVDTAVVTFSASDDLGNSYLGNPANWGTDGAGTVSGTLDFWPALDPKASRLDLVLTTGRARAVIAVPLTWDAAQ
ncbi:hypothetical protein I6A84_26205 [Frankia sp. CNm7]|uniref:Uncharacterized protein n=1 Tax=Frankia nepalensis TaxID=1836974 RepID=A0A937RM71_9ACTN|nr:hypothetical protein [Frankia nepalensis]MBL7501017.1 hypothetical protein [Frankia nepalensis]MBL7512492.1 hypothetical protein [Frankia nepalensis]MBL7521480.1 hypothetical protein [Frankia nepalensis]MBL7632795.1 hypothetical protein [Frankia nepalensis]